MPKVVSFRNSIFTNANRNLTEEKFNVLHCKSCTTHCLITDAPLDSLPRRRTDNAAVFDMQKWMVRLNTTVNGPIKVKRLKGIETQFHHRCCQCEELIGYQCNPPSESSKLFYVVDGSVLFPKIKRKSQWKCTVCGYICRDADHLEQHKRQRSHENQAGGSFKDNNDADGDAPIPPVIVG
ncbi:hypothetical protein IE077_001745 [Cardiosporidium cionae]|uniref:C2H2-type domain-containing protein n=1 Tax=Cardiosporidium cionae TaxID=476202 RepID=A0ABQ7JCD0_9APIC|nr:hypothetical protein IE077_001745 [Cardiosporidium cionae]|eukprot:KAF8821662.1 hypothetical protein IE077_001745 [Cardiosporidium cionae]